jgi:drug/metabolite transporter (DMT)-like permease
MASLSNLTLYLALTAGSFLAAGGQVLLKLGAQGRPSPIDFINPFVIGGLGLYGIGMVLWMIAFARLPMFVVYPFTLLTLGLVFAASLVVLGERPSMIVLAGWAIIGLGVAVVAVGAAGGAGARA